MRTAAGRREEAPTWVIRCAFERRRRDGRDARIRTRAGFYPLIFFSFSLAVRSFVRRRTTTTTTTSARSVVDAARRPRAAARLFGADLFGVSLTHRPFVIRRFKLKIQNRTPRRTTKRRFPRTREPYRSVFIARRRQRTTNENNDGCVNNLRVHAFATRDASSSSSSSCVRRAVFDRVIDRTQSFVGVNQRTSFVRVF